MDEGKIRQQGKPFDLYQFPNSDFSAEFFGTTNLISGAIKAVEPETQTLTITASVGNELRIRRMSQPVNAFTKGEKVSISVRGGSMRVTKDKPAGPVNAFQGTIEKAIYLGDVFDYEVKVKDMVLRAQGDPNEQFAVNQTVYLCFDEGASGVCCFKTT